jgi:Protein of unknown function (DUF2911)
MNILYKSFILYCSCCLLFSLQAGCQTSKKIKNTGNIADQGVLFLKLGNDTVSVQQFKMIGDSVTTTIIFKPGGIVVSRASGTLYPDGNLRSMNSTVYKETPEGVFQKTAENKLYTRNDSTFIEINANGKKTVKTYAKKCLVTNDMDITTFYVFPYWGHIAPVRVNDSLVGNHFGLGGSRPYIIKRIARNRVTGGSSLMGTVKFEYTDNGSLRSIDAVGSSLNLTGTVEKNIDMDSLIKAYVKHQQEFGMMGARTSRDTAVLKMGANKIEIDYWRPYMRGRKIFGNVVPWNRFWRTGANNATQLRISEPIYFDNKKLDSGRYSIFTLPTPTGWTMMINKQPDIWGTDYDANQDVMRIPVKLENNSSPVEELTIHISQVNGGGTIIIEWENTRAMVDFKTRPE